MPSFEVENMCKVIEKYQFRFSFYMSYPFFIIVGHNASILVLLLLVAIAISDQPMAGGNQIDVMNININLAGGNQIDVNIHHLVQSPC